MRAMILERVAAMDKVANPLKLVEANMPIPNPHEIRIRVSVCGVCHTELDEIEGRLMPKRFPIIPGHEVVGHVESCGDAAKDSISVGDRVGVGWIHHSSGDDEENISSQFVATGCDVDGGYAEFMTVPVAYAVPIPDGLSDTQAAPLMCAGAIGYRALRLCNLANGHPLGLMGFGGSAHLVLQLTNHLYPDSPVYVFTRESSVQGFARELGANWAGGIADLPPQQPRAMIDTTPAWYPVVQSLKKLQPGGRLVINAIRKEEADKPSLLELSYHEHLWMEREIKSVANLCYSDIAEFVPLAAKIPIRPEVTVYSLDDANTALQDLRRGTVKGAKVLQIG